jgi:hypothetical protein
METYTKLGITVFNQGETVNNLPRWAQAEDDEMTVGNVPVINAGGNEWYAMPLSSIDAVQLARDCADYSENTIDENRLAEVLQHEEATILYEEFYG